MPYKAAKTHYDTPEPINFLVAHEIPHDVGDNFFKRIWRFDLFRAGLYKVLLEGAPINVHTS